MSRSLRFALTFFLAACSGEDAQTEPPPAACVHSPYNGLEPACDFAPGPGSGRSEPAADKLPKPTGSCPAFTDGSGCRAEAGGALTCMFQPAGEPEREVRVWMPPGERVQPGPLVFYFYGLLGWPDNAAMPFAGFPQDVLQKLFDAGGILVAPQARADRNPPKLSRLPWIDALGFEDDMGDFLLIDEVVACAIEQVGIDVRHIHSTGLSAGAWMTAQVAVHRSNYIASVALFSGGIEGIQGTQDPSNKYPVIMFHGGTTDYVGAHFQNEAQSGVNLWRTLGHFAVSCNHEGGHSVPAQAALVGMQFLLDHPYGTAAVTVLRGRAARGELLCALYAGDTRGRASHESGGVRSSRVRRCSFGGGAQWAELHRRASVLRVRALRPRARSLYGGSGLPLDNPVRR